MTSYQLISDQLKIMLGYYFNFNIQDEQNTTSFCGSPAYLSPEMLNHTGAGKSSDLYGIGAVLYEMLVGEPPYYNDDTDIMYK